MQSNMYLLKKEFIEQQKLNEKYDISNIDDIYKIVREKAYKDMMPRTIKGLRREDIEGEDRDSNPLYCLSEEVYKYMISDKELSKKDFDDWHHSVCNNFIQNCREKIDKNEIIEKLTYGKVQKILNMTMKYVYCFIDSEEEKYERKFEFCHMALDRFTLEKWFSNDVLQWLNGNKRPKIYKKGSITNWSNLEYGGEEKECSKEYSYMWIQEKIREYLEKADHSYKINGKIMTPLQAEFYIWHNEKLKESLKPLLDYKETAVLANIDLTNDKIRQMFETATVLYKQLEEWDKVEK